MAKNVLFFSIREKTSIKISLMNEKKPKNEQILYVQITLHCCPFVNIQ